LPSRKKASTKPDRTKALENPAGPEPQERRREKDKESANRVEARERESKQATETRRDEKREARDSTKTTSAFLSFSSSHKELPAHLEHDRQPTNEGDHQSGDDSSSELLGSRRGQLVGSSHARRGDPVSGEVGLSRGGLSPGSEVGERDDGGVGSGDVRSFLAKGFGGW